MILKSRAALDLGENVVELRLRPWLRRADPRSLRLFGSRTWPPPTFCVAAGGRFCLAPQFGIAAQLVDISERIIHHLRKDHRPRRRERSPRPPKMQRRWMAVPDRFLPPRCRVDRDQWQGNFDEFPEEPSRYRLGVRALKAAEFFYDLLAALDKMKKLCGGW